MTLSPEARAALEAFRAKRDGIEHRFREERASRVDRSASNEPVKPVVADQKASISLLTETGTRLTADFNKARESFKASDRAMALEEAGGSSRADALKTSQASRAGPRDDRFGPDQRGRFGGGVLDPKNLPERPALPDKSRFGDSLGIDRVKFATAFRAYERVEASISPARAGGPARG